MSGRAGNVRPWVRRLEVEVNRNASEDSHVSTQVWNASRGGLSAPAARALKVTNARRLKDNANDPTSLVRVFASFSAPNPRRSDVPTCRVLCVLRRCVVVGRL